MTTLSIAVAGASGRMGQMLIQAIDAADDCKLVGALDIPGSPALGTDAGESLGSKSGVIISDDIDATIAAADYLIDFTRPEGTLAHLAACEKHRTAMIIGTTGLDADAKGTIEAAGKKIPIVFAPNMSVGVNVTFKLLEVAAKILSEGYDIEVIEAHHKHKIDAPSGTALRMGEVLADATGRDLEKVGVYAREGITGERDPQTIGFSTIRGGDIVGDHTVMFAGIGERIEITHKAANRMTYAHGSLRACRYLAGRSNGLFDMHDVLGLK